MEDALLLSATRQAELIRTGQISSAELVGAHLARIEAVNPRLNAVIEVFTERALAGAAVADRRIAEGAGRPLEGVPFSVKDSIEQEGMRCTAGTLGRAKAPVSARDATLVRRLREAGGIPIARTNLPDLLFSFESDNLLYGRTNNPYDSEYTSGGSSGGEAALIAAGGSPLGLGSDAAGSVRVPAAFCGIASIKPTSGRLPRTGHYPPSGGWIEALWQIGPMARRVEDLITVMPLLAGADGVDYTSPDMPMGCPRQVKLSELRVAFYTDNGVAAADQEVSAAVHGAAAALGAVARSVEEARPGCVADCFDLEMKLLGADGGDSLHAYLAEIGSGRVHPLLTGWLDRLEAYRTDVAGLQRYWHEWDSYRAEMARFSCKYDVVLCPAYIHSGLRHGESIQEDKFRGFSHTMAFNVSGWPAAVIRGSMSASRLPIAVQIAAAPWREDVVLAVAEFLEKPL